MSCHIATAIGSASIPRPFQVHRAHRPAHRRRQGENEADQIARSDQWIDQHRQSDGAEQKRNAARDAQPLAEHGIRQQRGPDRHRVGEDRHPRCRGRDLRERGKQREASDIQATGDDEMRPYRGAAHADSAALHECEREQRDGREARRAHPHAKRRDLVERELHRRPAQPPGQAHRDQHEAGPADGVVRGGGWHVAGFREPRAGARTLV